MVALFANIDKYAAAWKSILEDMSDKTTRYGDIIGLYTFSFLPSGCCCLAFGCRILAFLQVLHDARRGGMYCACIAAREWALISTFAPPGMYLSGVFCWIKNGTPH